MEAAPLRSSQIVVRVLLGIGLFGSASCSSLSQAAEISPCDRDQIGEDDGQLIGAYRVVDGELGELCFGAGDVRLIQSWSVLTDFATPAELAPVVVFAGFRADSAEGNSAGTGNIAFAGPLGESNEAFVVAVDLDEASRDQDELRVTMAHEFAHVFTQVTDQVDLETNEEDCSTFWNGSWCFAEGSYMADWVTEFWSDSALDSLPASGATDGPGGERRCNIDPSFLGAYAASHPEEDFAESFAAFVYSIEVPSSVDARQAFFQRYPELEAYRVRAIAAGETDLPNNFDRCG